MTPPLQPGQQPSFLEECWAEAAPTTSGQLQGNWGSIPSEMQAPDGPAPGNPDPPREVRGSSSAVNPDTKALLPQGLPPEWHEEWDERAAIMEYDGGMPRERAEALALADILTRMAEAKKGAS